MKIKVLIFTITASLLLGNEIYAQNLPSYVPSNGLVGWWPFSGNANDQSGNGNNGIVDGASLTSDRNSIFNTAFSFNGTSNYVVINLINAINTANVNGLTLSGWTNMTSLTNQPQSIIFMVDNLNSGFNTGYDHVSTKLYGQAGNAGFPADFNIKSLNTVLSNNWYNVVMTCDFSTNTSKLYINGELQSQSSATLITPVLTKIFIGSAYNQVWYQNGKLDDIGVWNRALTQQEITTLYYAKDCIDTITKQPTNQTININTNASFIVATTDSLATYQWQSDLGMGFQNISSAGQFNGATNDTLIVSNVSMTNNNQNFRCIVSTGICKDTSTTAKLTVNNNTGINSPSIVNALNVYPNPASTILHIDLEKPGYYTAKLSSFAGQSIISQTTGTVDVSALANGVYILNIYDSNNKLISTNKVGIVK